MAPPSASSLLQIGLDVLRTYVSAKTGSILAQLGDVVGETVDADGVEWWQHVGFISRPPKASKGKSACQTIAARRGSITSIFASRDLRGQKLAGQIGDGETCVYAPGEDGNAQGRLIIKKDGSIHLYTREGNTESGGGMVIQVDAMNDTIRLINSQGYGIIIDPDGVRVTAGPSAGLTLKNGGKVELIGTGQAQIDGASILLGATGAPGANNVIMGPAGIAGVPNPKIIAGL